MTTSSAEELHGFTVTGSSGVHLPDPPSQTFALIARAFAMLRDETEELDTNAGEYHREALLRQLEFNARDRARRNVRRLLEELSTQRGMAWSDIARLVGVSVQALRKWRSGEQPTGEHRLAVARLAAFMGMLEDELISDPAGWLEMPLLDGYAPRNIDLYAERRYDLLFELAGMRIAPEAALARLDPNWRERFRLEHDVFEADDGNLSIRRRRDG